MDILIPDSWLRDFLKTKATPTQIAEYLSLCGPSVEQVEKTGADWIYHIEITTNRIDSASVLGIAREAAAILPRFGINAYLKPIKKNDLKVSFQNQNLPLDIKLNTNKVRRVMAAVIDNVSPKESPVWMRQRLELSGLRSLNLLVDITNYVMLETGHPTHVFDYDRIRSHKLILRESKKGEKITTLENKTYQLPGNDIVIDDGNGEIIDLPGIIGTANSVVTTETKRIIFFIDNNSPVHMRRTSMSLGIRTLAVTINEKDVDPQLAEIAFARGIHLYLELCKGKIVSKLFNIYKNPYTPKKIIATKDFIEKRLGVDIEKKDITKFITPLGFATNWKDNELLITVPSWRESDITIPEDIVEEVARLYGYHNLPSQVMGGQIPDPLVNSPFDFEQQIKNILQGWGGVEVYTLSLVAQDKVDLTGKHSWALKLRNPLGEESEYLRTSLAPLLIMAAQQNAGEKQPFQLFEMANVYLPVRGKLPEEKIMLAGILVNYEYRIAKGIVEALLEKLRVKSDFISENFAGFLPNKRLVIKSGQDELGQFGVMENGQIYYELGVEELRGAAGAPTFQPIPKYPAQIEDISLIIPTGVLVGNLVKEVYHLDRQIVKIELFDIYEDSFTFRLTYQNPRKTLTDREVEKIRQRIIKLLHTKFGVRIK